MTIEKLISRLNLNILTGDKLLQNRIKGCYIGDLLSWVMAKAEQGNVWITVMGNVNAIAVAVLTDVPCIILSENASLDNDAKERAIQNDIVILSSDKNSYSLAVEINNLYTEEQCP